MIITRVSLVGYIMLGLNKIQSITITPVNILSLICGSNGSGKTSLLREFTPTPGNRNHYHKGGSKTISLVHNDSTYVLHSDFSKSQTHSFIKDGIELNKSLNISTQRELIESEFNYSPIVHSLSIGDTQFCSMSTAARRDLLFYVNPIDMQYVNTIFDRTKIVNRDTQGIVKHAIAQSADISDRMSKLGYTTDMDEAMVGLEDTLAKLSVFSVQDVTDYDTVKQDLDYHQSRLDNVIKEYSLFDNTRCILPGIHSQDDLLQAMGGINGQLTSNHTTMIDLCDTLDSMRSNTGMGSITTLSTEELRIKHKELTQLIAGINGTTDNRDYLKINTALHTLSNQLDTVLNTPDTTYYTDNEIKTLRDTVSIHQWAVTENNARASQMSSKLDHYLLDESTVVCPSCSLKFYPGGNDIAVEIGTLKSKIAICNKAATEAADELSKLAGTISSIDAFESKRDSLRGVLSNANLGPDFWSAAPSEESIISNPSSMTTYINKVINTNTQLATLRDYEAELGHCNNALVLKEKYGDNTAEEMAKLSNEIDNLVSQKATLTNTLNKLKILNDNYSHYSKLTDHAEELVAKLDTLSTTFVKSTIKEDAKARCKEIYSQLSRLQHVIKQHDVLRNAYTEIENDKVKQIERQRVLTNLVKALSPTKGIIADNMLGFIHSFVDQMNKVINAVWTYPLVLSPHIGLDGTIDYKFTIDVDGNTVDDISSASKGQQGIINFAFTMVMREYLNLNDYPIFLDEIGDGFDETHINRFMQYIKRLVESDLCNQIFMVNHYSSVYGSLVNNDIIVLDTRNVAVPDNYNGTTEIKYEE